LDASGTSGLVIDNLSVTWFFPAQLKRWIASFNMTTLTRTFATLLALVTFACSGFHGFTFRVPTDSMIPTVNPGDSVFADLFYYKHSLVNRGDIVVVKDPDGKMTVDGKRQEMYVKRIVGVGGDKIQIASGKVYVNDRVLDGFASGKYAADFPVDDFGPVVVPQGHYFLVGDNLANSYDSRQWKHSTVDINGIYGKVTAIQNGKTKNIRYL
jgi:signal peptidase I